MGLGDEARPLGDVGNRQPRRLQKPKNQTRLFIPDEDRGRFKSRMDEHRV